jgi:hypothetical protein
MTAWAVSSTVLEDVDGVNDAPEGLTCGDTGIWARLRRYVDILHGNNVAPRELVGQNHWSPTIHPVSDSPELGLACDTGISDSSTWAGPRAVDRLVRVPDV